MKLNLAQDYNRENRAGQTTEILSIKRDNHYSSGFAALTKLDSKKDPVWLTIDWFLPNENATPTNESETAKS